MQGRIVPRLVTVYREFTPKGGRVFPDAQPTSSLSLGFVNLAAEDEIHAHHPVGVGAIVLRGSIAGEGLAAAASGDGVAKQSG